EHELPDAEDRVRELAGGDGRYARADAEALARREGEEGPVEVEVLAGEAPGQGLVGGDGIVRIARRAADGGGDLVAERNLHAEARADALAVPRRHVGPVLLRLVVEALVADAHVTEDGGALEPVGFLDRLLRLGGRDLR